MTLRSVLGGTLAASFLFCFYGCATSGDDAPTTSAASSGTGAGSGAGGGGGAAASTATGQGGDDTFDAGASGGSDPGESIIYAHTDTTLFRLDAESPTLDLTLIGDFDCVGGEGQDVSMTDLAVDGEEQLWGISQGAVHPLTVEDGVVHCGTPIPLDNPLGVRFYGLTFAPKGVLDPNKEVLVAGNTAGELWSIDEGGGLAKRGRFGKVPADDGHGHSFPNAGKDWELSGDIVFLANGGAPVGFATVRDCPDPPQSTNCNPINTLLEIDVASLAAGSEQIVTKAVRGQIVGSPGCSDGLGGDYGGMYGIAAWDAKVFGLSRTGNLVEIDPVDGTGCLVKTYPSYKFAGAGVTTIAPIEPPPS
jgi:hypothetical protein